MSEKEVYVIVRETIHEDGAQFLCIPAKIAMTDRDRASRLYDQMETNPVLLQAAKHLGCTVRHRIVTLVLE
jgi:hypothetical protein